MRSLSLLSLLSGLTLVIGLSPWLIVFIDQRVGERLGWVAIMLGALSILGGYANSRDDGFPIMGILGFVSALFFMVIYFTAIRFMMGG